MRTEGLQARADLEALVETSPVGVVVFDARTGRPVSLNREVKRIVESLRMPGHPPEALLEMITWRLGDGHEILLDRFPLAGCVKTPSQRGTDPRNRHSRESGNPGGVERGNAAVAPLHHPWIPAFARMTDWPFAPRSWPLTQPASRRAEQRGDGARRRDGALDLRRADRHDARQRDPDPRRRRRRWWSPCRTLRSWSNWSGCGRSSWAW